jgi:putative DNA primase/helicase
MKTYHPTKSAASLPAGPRGTNNVDPATITTSVTLKQGLHPWQTTPEPWPEAVDGTQLLDALQAQFKRFIVLPEHAAATMALWIVHTYCYQFGRVAAYVALLSPEKRCGKSTGLSLVAALAHRALAASNVLPAALFRVIERDGPTMLIDEVDSFVGDNEELRGILNAGFTRESAFVLRCVGENHEPKTFNVFGPKLFAGIGKLPGTLADRSIIVPMRRKQPGDTVERFRGFDGKELGRKCVRWVKDNEAHLTDSDPPTPDALNDRAADLWRPLLTIADLAGGEWPALARLAAVGLSADKEDDSQTVKLLLACRAYFTQHPVDRVLSKDLLAFMNAQEEEPWTTFNHGDGLNPRQLADRLKPYGIKSRTMRDGLERARGYFAEDFTDAFARYLPAPPTADASVTA